MESIAEDNSIRWQFENSYARLPDVFFAPAKPVKVLAPKLTVLNHRLAAQLGLDVKSRSAEQLADLFAGQVLPGDAMPIAQAYAGHQFGSFTMLGDGRAILLGEHRTPSGQLVDVQLKGAGQTQFSRRGDGRAALGPMLREYLISEALFALGIPTTRSLAVVTTGEPVYRTKPLRGAILTRVAASHIRVGTFEYAAARRDVANLRALADYTIARHYPDLNSLPENEKYLAFLRAVMDRQASLIAQWQMVGFIHGVMNTDNMAISGETIDFGPCAFMNRYDPETVFSSIDYGGRYAYGNQPGIAQWNLARFAEALLSLIDADQEKSVELATGALNEFPALFQQYWLAGMRRKLGLLTDEADDEKLVRSLLEWMHETQADFTNTFRDLSSEQLPEDSLYQEPKFQAWYSSWRDRLARNGQPISSAFTLMRSVNPAVIPRNHRVEEALSRAEEHDDVTAIERLLTVLSTPYELSRDVAEYQEPPADDSNYQTFCGT